MRIHLDTDLRSYQFQRKAALLPLQIEARDSAEWFETVDGREHGEPARKALAAAVALLRKDLSSG